MICLFSKNWLKLAIIFVLAFGVAFASGSALKTFLKRSKAEPTQTQDSEPPVAETLPAVDPTPQFINLQPTVDTWRATLPANANLGLEIYDLDNSQIAAEYNADEPFFTASVYKLFYVYDGYREIDAGRDDGEKFFVKTADKGDLTVYDCLDLMIRESYNGCADPMRADATRTARVQNMRGELELKNTSNAGLYSSASDLVKLMQLFWQHEDLSADSWAKIKDSMLVQPPTTYNWRQGLPSGFTTALVYDKVGWNRTGNVWATYNDVAFVEFPAQNRHYIVVVITEKLPDFTPLVRLGEMLESAILGN